MSANDPNLESTLKQLRELRGLLLSLHKALLESEKLEYERSHGTIQSRGEFFQLVIGHEWFDWLRPISQFIVQIDETLSAKEPIALSTATDLLKQGRSLLKANETGTVPEQRYYWAIQRDPDIAFMHIRVSQLLDKVS